MVRLFVEPDKDILNIINKGIEKCNNNLLRFSKEVKICRTTIYHWVESAYKTKKFESIMEVYENK